MAKIGNLQVDTLNIAANAVTGANSADGSGNGRTSVGASNPGALPVQIFFYVDVRITITSSSAYAECTFTADRVRGSKILFDYTVTRDGSGMVELRNTVLDISAAASDVYRINVIAVIRNGAGGTNFATVEKREIAVEWVQK